MIGLESLGLIFVTLLLIVIAIVAIKIGISFDINKFLEMKQEQKVERLRLLCPHAILEMNGDQPMIRSLITSPSGTRNWICSRCGYSTHDENMVTLQFQQYTENLDLFIDKDKKFSKFVKKHYKV